MNSQRPVITYENVYLLKGKPGAHSLQNNSGAAISSVEYVQGINFSVDNTRTNLGAVGAKGFIDKSIRTAPDVQLTVNVLETFRDESLFSGLISGNHNLDQNFYAIIGNKRSVDFKDISMDGSDAISFGNCFLNSVAISQSTNGILTSQYSYVGSNLEAQKITASSLGGFTGKAPSINLSGNQLQDIKFQFTDPSSYYTSDSDFLITSHQTRIEIGSNDEDGAFLIKPDTLQNFNLNLPVKRKAIYSLGKKYPVKRKPLFPSLGSINFTALASDFESTDSNKNLKDFLNFDHSFKLRISFDNKKLQNFSFQIRNAKLKAHSYNSALESQMASEFSLEFDVSDLKVALDRLMQETEFHDGFAILLEDGNNILT